MTSPLAPMMMKLGSFITLTNAETLFLESIGPTSSEVGRHTALLREGESHDHSFVLVSGWGFCYKQLADGRRQIVNFSLPGDFLGLPSQLLRTVDRSYSTISACRVCRIENEQIQEIFSGRLQIALAFLWAIARDEAIIVEHMVNVGRRTAIESMAHLMAEFLHRLRLVSLADGDAFECFLTQDDLADALGLSNVHVNRVLRQLRDSDVLTFRDRVVTVGDIDRLVALAGYDPGYLDQQPRSGLV